MNSNTPLVFNSIKAGEEIMQQIEAIRRQRSVPDLYTDTSLAGLGARYWAEGEYNLRANQNGATQAAAGVRMGKPTWPTSVRFRDFVRP